MTCKATVGDFGREKASAAHLAQVNMTRRHFHRVKLLASRQKDPIALVAKPISEWNLTT